MTDLKFILSDATSLLPTIYLGLKKIYPDLRQSHEFSENERMQMVFTMEELLDVAIEGWPDWDLNPQPLNSVQTLKPSLNEVALNAI